MFIKKKANSDLQGLIRIITDAVLGITDIVEVVHRQIVHAPFLPSTPIQHLITDIADITFKKIRINTRLISKNADKAMGQLPSVLREIETSEERDAVQSVLNGIIGDYLEKNGNPLKISMQFRHQGKAMHLDSKSLEKAYPNVNGKILLMVHGLCMNDIQWTRKGHDHGTALANELRKTAVYLRYNSGRHISTNGQDFNNLLEKLVQHWPVPLEELVIIGHSMGGLVSRSALHYGQQQNKSWTKYLKKIIFLGTPHHGAPLEKAGNYIDVVLDAVPFTKPFARLGKIRSAGITDLRYGNLADEDWENYDRFEMRRDQRLHIPLPEQVTCYCIAGTVGKATESVSSKLPGDNIVSIKSALGQHKNPTKDLGFKKENTLIAYETSHLDLLCNPIIYSQINTWLV